MDKLRDSQESSLKKGVKSVCSALELMDEGLAYKSNDFRVRHLLSKLNIDAFYFVKSLDSEVPIICFKELESYDKQEVYELHSRIWNSGVPFLMLILPDQIRVYNTLVPSRESTLDEDSLVNCIALVQVASERMKTIRSKLFDFTREELESSLFWRKDNLKLDSAKRIDDHLSDNLRKLRENLVNKNLTCKTANNLIGRCILTSYLWDRRIITPEFLKTISEKSACFTEILSSRESTYQLFEAIHKKFNGDAFPILDDELKEVKQSHLKIISHFLEGGEILKDGNVQMTLIPYKFDVIPVEIISSIYEEFLSTNDFKDKGCHYTPHHLVKMALDTTYKGDRLRNKRFLDPSCGSGIFLVETYQRLLEEWIDDNKRLPSWKDLTEILTSQIYGVDIDESAIRIAIFSLYLKMLDFISDIQNIRFPQLYNKNLICSDFLDESPQIKNLTFDYIIGNPPWVSSDDPRARELCNREKVPFSDKQMAVAFICKIRKIAKAESKACLILPAKTILFNRSPTGKEFREYFFDNFNVKLILNLSLFRTGLFKNAVSPATIVVYGFSGSSEKVLYICPKPSPESVMSSYVIIRPQDMIFLPKNKINESEHIWKIAMWGNSLDGDIIERLEDYPKLGSIISEKNLPCSVGYKVGDAKEELRLMKIKTIAANEIGNYHLDFSKAKDMTYSKFERSISDTFEIFLAPHVLIRKNRLMSAFVDKDLSFGSNVMGIHGDDLPLLKYISVVINSHLTKYYQFLTSSNWAVERDYVLLEEIKDTPFFIPNKKDLLRIEKIHDKIQAYASSGKDFSMLDKELNSIIYQVYNISPIEVNLIEDTLRFGLSIFTDREDSEAYIKATKQDIKTYLNVFLFQINNLLKYDSRTMNATLFYSKGSLNGLVLSVDKTRKPTEIIDINEGLSIKLNEIYRSFSQEYSKMIRLQKPILIFNRNKIILVKSGEKLSWSFKQAIADASNMVSDILIEP